ncbi:MAG: class I SAM-dependent methyltransferase [Verrucomicrobiota bacterium]
MPTLYDTIGDTYGKTRQADQRIVDRIIELLELSSGTRILDIGAGTGNYSLALAERGFNVTALEPSTVMSDQAPVHPRVTWLTTSAENLPFENASFDAAILILSIHHFSDVQRALEEAQRVTQGGRVLIFTYDPSAIDDPWLFHYFPAFRTQIRKAFPTTEHIAACFGSDYTIEEHPFPLPHDLKDSFAGAAWRTPERYLDPDFRDGTSAFRQLDSATTEACLGHLRVDLESGRCDRTNSEVRELTEYDHGYNFIVATRN